MIRVVPEILLCLYCGKKIEYEENDKEYIIEPLESPMIGRTFVHGYKKFFIKCPCCNSILDLGSGKQAHDYEIKKEDGKILWRNNC